MFKPGDRVRVNTNYPWYGYYTGVYTVIATNDLYNDIATPSGTMLFRDDELDLV